MGVSTSLLQISYLYQKGYVLNFGSAKNKIQFWNYIQFNFNLKPSSNPFLNDNVLTIKTLFKVLIVAMNSILWNSSHLFNFIKRKDYNFHYTITFRCIYQNLISIYHICVDITHLFMTFKQKSISKVNNLAFK